MENLEQLLDELDGTLEEIASKRASIEGQVNGASTDIDLLLSRLERVAVSMDTGLNHAEVFVSNVDNVLRPSGHQDPTGESAQSAASLDQLLERVGAYAEEVVSKEDISRMGDLSEGGTARLRQAIEEVASDQLQKFDDVLAWIDDKLAELVEASEDILEAATTFSQAAAEAKETLVGKTDQVADSVKQLVASLDNLTKDGSEALSQQLAIALAERISEQVDALTNGALHAVANFSDRTEQLADGIVDQLSSINDTFGEVLEIVEPIQPVIELAGSIS